MNHSELNNNNQIEQNVGLDDLRLTGEELDGIKGGCGPFHKDEPEQPTAKGVFINNHNESAVSDEALLADLEPIGEIKGGPVVMQDCLVSSYQTGSHDGAGIPYSGTTTVNQGVLTIR